jgi:hypothetical protein
MRFRIATAALCLIGLVWFMQPLWVLGGSGWFQDSKVIAATWVGSVGGQPARQFCDFVSARYWNGGGVQSACPYSITRAGNGTCTDVTGNLLRVGNGTTCINSAGFGSSFTASLLQSPTSQASNPVAYYFDSVAGSDSNNCLSTRAPCVSTTKMAALRYRGGDTINWKAGSSFTGCLALNANNVRNTRPLNP